MSDILATLYASAPADDPIIHTVEIRSGSGTPFYVCSGDEDFTAKLQAAKFNARIFADDDNDPD